MSGFIKPRPSREQLGREVAVYRECMYNVSETARRLGLARQTLQSHLEFAWDEGLLEDGEGRHEPNGAKHDDYVCAMERRKKRFAAKKSKGDWRKPSLITLPPRPFMLKIFGDPHLDADGCNVELFAREWMHMDVEQGIYGLCVGDWFNNWLKALSHLLKHEADPEDAWTIFEYLMQERGEALLAACSGNHDDWTHAPTDPVDYVLKQHGVRYRIGAIRLMLAFDGLEPLTIGMRHKWRGASIYSAAHGIRRGVEKGWSDLVSIGGHIHQDEPRLFRLPDGRYCHICQVSSFKEYDDYVDVQGFQGMRISPVWNLVIDPRLADTDPDKVKTFWDIGAARKYLEAIR